MVITILFLSLIIYLFYQQYGLHFWAFSIAFLLKLLAGIGVGILYKYHYQHGDILNYLKDIHILQELSWQEYGQYLTNQVIPEAIIYDEFQPRALLFVKILSVFNLIAQGDFWALSLLFSTINFVLCWWIFWILIQIYPHLKKLFYVCLFLNPSFVFWTSGLMKESGENIVYLIL